MLVALWLSQAAMAAPTAQTTAAASATIVVLQDVCLPLLQGGSLTQVARAAHLKTDGGQWFLPIAGKQRIELQLPDVANPHICGATIIDRAGDQPSILKAINAWGQMQTPAFAPIKVQQRSSGPLYLRTTSTWSAQTPARVVGLVFSQEKTLAGEPVLGDLDQSVLLASVTPLS